MQQSANVPLGTAGRLLYAALLHLQESEIKKKPPCSWRCNDAAGFFSAKSAKATSLRK